MLSDSKLIVRPTLGHFVNPLFNHHVYKMEEREKRDCRCKDSFATNSFAAAVALSCGRQVLDGSRRAALGHGYP